MWLEAGEGEERGARFPALNGRGGFSSVLWEVLRLGNVPWSSSSRNRSSPKSVGYAFLSLGQKKPV